MLLVLTALVASGCLPEEMPTAISTPTPTFTAVPQTVEDSGGEGDQPEVAPTPAETVPEATPFDLVQLRATDPTTVDLASGQPTLLEFFAFW
jgi:hypothetical protein